MSIQEAAHEAQANFCEDALERLTASCRAEAKGGSSPIDLSLALCSLFGGIVLSLHDQPTPTSQIEALSGRLGSLLKTLEAQGISEQSRAEIVAAIGALRDLL